MNMPIRKIRGAVLIGMPLIGLATLQWHGAIQMAYRLSQDTSKEKLAFWGMNCIPLISALTVISGFYLLFTRAKDPQSETRRQRGPS